MINKLIAIKLLWGLLCYLCYLSISIWWFRLWIIPNTLDFLSKAFIIWCSVSYTRYTLSNQCYVSYTRYTPLSTLDLTLPSRALMHPIVSELSLQDVHPSSLVVLSLPAFSLCHLATTLVIQWESWRLSQKEKANCV